LVIVDGLKGEVHINPTSEQVEQFQKINQEYEAQKDEWAKLVNEKTVSADGVHVELACSRSSKYADNWTSHRSSENGNNKIR
jgi:phosphotransferase system enzyme I (PtsI)